MGGLGYFMILAKKTGQVAAKASHGKNGPSGMEPVERFFLDGIQREGGDLSVRGRDEFAVLVFPCQTQSGLSVPEAAVMKTDRALDRMLVTHGFCRPFITCCFSDVIILL